ncbi:hypothetical protein NAT51_01655 [Flavobacterium amniphilum]|uniref:hypothetical protein n=1 Tax=Flavobacterium amniphilum TaxID=1834035 RepID=UPI00202AA27F|nr:hypothetical protein [Flavobacterium amniphilum]MCL9804212.1 hypothetical protein [Flavobacterium amniphilum]
MKNIHYISLLAIILVGFRLDAQVADSGKMITIGFQTVGEKTNGTIPGSIIEVLSDKKRIGWTETNYDGIARIRICSKKITDGKITVNVFGMRCKVFRKEYTVSSDAMFKIQLEDGETKYRTIDDKMYILQQLNVAPCSVEMTEVDESDSYYRHCDGRIKKRNEIPANDLYEWELLVKE